MKCYVLYNTESRKFVYDADYNSSPPEPCISRRKMWLFDSAAEAGRMMEIMQLGTEYQIMRAEFNSNDLKRLKHLI